MSGEERAGNQSQSGTQAREAQEQEENAGPPHSGLRPRAEAPGAQRGVGFAETTWVRGANGAREKAEGAAGRSRRRIPKFAPLRVPGHFGNPGLWMGPQMLG